MRESIGTTWILQLVIVFILLFVSFLTLSLNYSKAYKTKNEMLSIIEKYEGLNSDSIKIINNYLSYNNYKVKSKCPTDGIWYGQTDISGNNGVLEQAVSNKDYYYCVRKRSSNRYHYYYFYEVKVFLTFNIPIFGDFAKFTINGSTADVLTKDIYTASN